jgi:hypothetical protein
MKIHCRWLLPIAAAGFLLSTASVVKATPYASEVTNNNGTIQFYLNESNATITVTYEDGSTNANFNGFTAGTNLPAGPYSFALAGHTTYAISVFKVGSGVPSVIKTLVQSGTQRGVAVNVNIGSPYFGRVYWVNGGVGVWVLNPDLSFTYTSTARTAGVTTFGSSGTGTGSSPYRLSVATNDYVIVGDASTGGAAVYLMDPAIATNQLLLGPVGNAAGTAAGSHGTIVGPPMITGSLAGGNLTLYQIDGELAPFNSIQVYQFGTTNTPPWITPPSYTGAEVGLNLDSVGLGGNEYCGLTRGPNGYLYASTQRNDLSKPTVQIYDSTGVTNLWNSWLPAGTAYPGGTPSGDAFTNQIGGFGAAPVDSSVTPDGSYLFTENINNGVAICPLTNGIPNLAGKVLVANPGGSTGNGRGISADAADNIYVSSSGLATLQEWSLGLTATTVTTGNASGQTGFNISYPTESVSVSTANALISQQNTYGNPTNTSITITRTGDLSVALQVNFTYSGTATGNSSYTASYVAGSTGSVILGVGQSSTNINIAALTDGVSRPTTVLTLSVSGSANYSITPPSTVSINILNTGPQKIFSATGAPSMYNAFSNDYVSLSLTRWGDTNAAAYTVNSFTILGGTAVEGTDYTPPSAVTIHPGDALDVSYIYPLINGQPPVDTTNGTYVGNKTIIASAASGAGYTAVASTNTFTIIDHKNPTATILFSDALADANDVTNWGVRSANDNMQTNGIDEFVDFGYDLFDNPRDPVVINGFGQVPVPFPPNGATNALRLTVNKTGPIGAAAAVDLYPTNVTFSGNYAVRFNMNMLEGAGSTTEGAMFGINHSGTATNWWAGSGIQSGWSSVTNTTWESDGVWYWVSVDGGAAIGSYVAFTGVSNSLPNTGWKEISGLSSAGFNTAFKTNVFTSSGGPGLAGNGDSDAASDPSQYGTWSDVEIKQYNNVVTLSIDKTRIITYTNTTTFTNGTIMLGYEDPFDSLGTAQAAVLYSNLRVVQLGPPAISQLVYNPVGGTFVFNFTTPDGSLTTSSFTVLGTTNLNSAFTTVTGATITQLSNGAYQATVPVSGPNHFYHIQQQY